MKNIAVIFCLFIIVGLNTGCVNNTTESEGVKLISAEEMQTILELEDVQLIDVRTPSEHNEIYIDNSQNIDFMSPTFEEDILKLDKSLPVVLYCKSGNRSGKCAKMMKAAGFQKVYDLEGGISKWEHSDKLDIKAKS